VRVHLVCPPPALEGPLDPPRHPPHYAAIVAAALRDGGHEVSITDQYGRTTDLGAVIAEARAKRPDLLLLLHSDYNRAHPTDVLEAVAGALVQGLPDTAVWGFGRLHEAAAKRAMERLPSLPGLLFDEPEFAAVELAAALAAGEEPVGLPATVRRVEGELVATRATRRDLDDSPVPAWDLVDPRTYDASPHQSSDGVFFPVLASRGCPFPCFYCEVQARPPYRARSVGSVIAELNAVHERYGVDRVFLADPTFAVQRDWTLEFCRRVADEGPPGLRWCCMSRTDRVDKPLLQAMADAGCDNVLFGVESLDPAVLRATDKQLDPTTVGPAIRAAQEAGLEVIASIMIGLPTDTPAGFLRTLRQLIAMEPDFAQFFVVQIPGEEVPDGGACTTDWGGSRFDFWGRVYVPESFAGADHLAALRRQAFRRFYLRPGYVRGRVGRMLKGPRRRQQVARLARGASIIAKLAVGRA